MSLKRLAPTPSPIFSFHHLLRRYGFLGAPPLVLSLSTGSGVSWRRRFSRSRVAHERRRSFPTARRAFASVFPHPSFGLATMELIPATAAAATIILPVNGHGWGVSRTLAPPCASTTASTSPRRGADGGAQRETGFRHVVLLFLHRAQLFDVTP